MLYLEQFQKVSVCLLVTELSSYLANQVPECHVSCRRHLFPFAALLYKCFHEKLFSDFCGFSLIRMFNKKKDFSSFS